MAAPTSAGAQRRLRGRRPARSSRRSARPALARAQTAVVVGGSQGTGRAVALALAERGVAVCIAARSPAALEEAEAAVRLASAAAPGGAAAPVLAVPTDVTDASSVAALADAVTERFGADVDLLVNCQGACCTMSFADHTDEDWDWQMQTNVLGAVRTTRAFLPALQAGSGGAVINVNSFGGVIPLRGMSAYTASKYALYGMSEALRTELAPKGVHVGQVHPGIIDSDFLERAKFGNGEEGTKAMRKTLDTLPIVQKPAEVAAAVLDAWDNSKAEVVVGPAFQGMVAMYRATGLNPFAVADAGSASTVMQKA